jgi:hypothetical protein
MAAADQQHVREALDAIVAGDAVKRSRHDLLFEGADLTPLLLEVLAARGYVPLTVDAVEVFPGERVPAFFVRETTAFFGWVFWEQFTSWKIRKLWGSVVKNRRGDWDLQIPAGSPVTVYANPALKIEMDIDHPPSF